VTLIAYPEEWCQLWHWLHSHDLVAIIKLNPLKEGASKFVALLLVGLLPGIGDIGQKVSETFQVVAFGIKRI